MPACTHGRDDRHFGGHSHDRGGGRPRTNQGNRQFETSRPTESEVVLNYCRLNPIEPSLDMEMRIYKVCIRSASFQVQKDDAGNKIIDPATGNLLRKFTSTELSDEFKTKFFKTLKPWRIYKKLVQDELEKDPLFVLSVSNLRFCLIVLSSTVS